MFKRFFKKFVRENNPEEKVVEKEKIGLSTHRFLTNRQTYEEVLREAFENTYRVTKLKNVHLEEGFAQDAIDCGVSTFGYGGVGRNNLSPAVIAWYGSQGFLPYQVTAMIGQHWLVDKACTMPAEDAVRKGFDLTVNDGEKIGPEILSEIERCNREFRLDKNLIEYVRFGRMFGIRLCLFLVDSDDPDFYYKPFNPDGVTPGSYKGMCQIDPQWVVPQLDMKAASNPMDKNFYVPTWWQISGSTNEVTKQINSQYVHRSHFAIFIESEVADILKPTYLWGGVSVPQKIAERVYCSERTANEAPLLAMTKRILLYKTDLENAVLNQQKLTERLNWAVQMRNNYGYQMMDTSEEVQQLETTLTDLDEAIMSQYQLVASASGVPATKLLGTVPKGFNSTGDYEINSYHEMLESLQENHMSELIEKHLIRVMKSSITTKFNKDFEICVKWKPLRSLSAEQLANVNKLKADTDVELVQTGAISGEDVRKRLIADVDSGYNGIEMYESSELLTNEENEEPEGVVPRQEQRSPSEQVDTIL